MNSNSSAENMVAFRQEAKEIGQVKKIIEDDRGLRVTQIDDAWRLVLIADLAGIGMV